MAIKRQSSIMALLLILLFILPLVGPSLPFTTTSSGSKNLVPNAYATSTFGLTSTGSTSYPTAKAITANGNAQVDTAQSVFGSASGLFDGTGDYLTLADSADWYFGTGPVTIDFQIRFAALPASGSSVGLIGQYQDATNKWKVYIYNNAGTYEWRFRHYPNSSTQDISIIKTVNAYELNTWYHVAFVRSGTSSYSYYWFQGGTQCGTTGSGTNDLHDFAGSLYVGWDSDSSGSLNGQFDEVRISNVARWTAAFTPPTARYDRDSYTVYLDHMDGADTSTTFLDDVTTGQALFYKFTLPDSNALISSMSVYNNASVAGNARLSVFTDSSGPSSRVCETADTAVAAKAWTSPSISCSALSAADYWLGLQWTNTTAYAAGPSYTAGSANAGYRLYMAYGAFPASGAGGTLTAEQYSVYATYSVVTTVTITFALSGVSSVGGTIMAIDASNYVYGDFPKAFSWEPSSTHDVAATDPITVTANQKQYAFSSWTNGNGLVTASGTYTTPASNTTTTATYTTQWYILSSTGYGGSITASAWVTNGDSKAFTISANGGFAIGNVIVDTGYVGKGSSYTFSNVVATHTISAAFQDQSGHLFSVMQITDTQMLSQYHSALFTNTTNWVVNNTGTFNTQMVVHTGDIVNNCNATDEWSNANTAMLQLLNNNIPYAWAAGNHDPFSASSWGGWSRQWLGINYAAFNATAMQGKPYWVSDILQGKDTAVKFSYEGKNFLIINMEYLANSTVISWMTNLIDSYPSYNIIVTTHFYLSTDGDYVDHSSGNDVWSINLKTIIDSYPNVFLTMNGHQYGSDISGDAYQQMVGTREETMFNLQDEDSTHGAATVRVFTFNSTSATVVVSTYSVYSNTWQPYSTHSYSFSAYLDHAITFALNGVSNDASGTILTIDSTAYTYSDFPKVFNWVIGTDHTVAASTVSAGTGKQYVFSSWTNGDGLAGASGTYTTPSSAATVTVNYKTQWAVNFTSSGIAGDTSGTVVTIGGTAKTQALLPFTSWVDDTTGSVAYAYSSPVSATEGKQYVWSSTSGCSVNTQSGTVSVVTASCLVTGTYGIQYYFQVTDAHDSATGQGWYDDGANVASTVTRPSGGYDTTGWTGTGSLTSGGSAGSSTTGDFVIHAASTCVWNWVGTITIAHLKITTVGGGSNLTATDPYTYYEFQVNVTDTGTMNNVENVTIRVEQNPSVAIESDTPGYVQESKYWFRYDNETNSWEWYNGSSWTGTSTWLDAANCSKPSSSATQGYFKFKIRLSKIAAKAANWDFDAIAHDLQIGATATKKFDAFTVNAYIEYQLSTSEITWNVNPGDVNATATSTLTITVTSNTVVKIQIDGNGDLTRVGESDTIPLANVVVDDDSDPGTDARCLKLTQSDQDWWISIPAGANQEYTMYWFLSVPSPSPTGTYVFTFYITVSE